MQKLKLLSKSFVFEFLIFTFKKNSRMKKANLLMALAVLLFSSVSYSAAAQGSGAKAKYIEAFDEGRALNSTDIKFLNLISDGNGDRDAIVNGKKYSVGQRLAVEEASALNYAKSKFRKGHPMEKASDAKPINKTVTHENCFWYSYCGGNGNCYYVWYCD